MNEATYFDRDELTRPGHVPQLVSGRVAALSVCSCGFRVDVGTLTEATIAIRDHIEAVDAVSDGVPCDEPLMIADRMPQQQPGWWCWRCGWWQCEQPGRYRPSECPECGPWSKERRLPLNTVRSVRVTVEDRA